MSAAPLSRLFGLLPRDQQSNLWGPFSYHEDKNDNAASITAGGPGVFTWPAGYSLFLTHVFVRGFGAGAVFVTTWTLLVEDLVGNDQGFVMQQSAPSAAAVAVSDRQQLDFVLPEEHSLKLNVFFSAAGANNRATLSAFGYLIPKGNISLF